MSRSIGIVDKTPFDNYTLEKANTQNWDKVEHAVILAAGNGSRFKEKGVELPKVLLKVGGLRLLERAVLSLNQIGVKHFYIVVGAYKEQIIEVMSKIKRLEDLDINFVECADYNLGNGVSFGKGAEQIDAPFLLTMSDHIFSIKTLQSFVDNVKEVPNLPALACDPKLEDVFDMDDATKVQSKDGFIHKINKELSSYDLIDTGLFYFPANYGKKIAQKAREGAHGVSDIMKQLIAEKGVRTAVIKKAIWQDVDNPSMRKEAEKRLLKTLIKDTDGWVSKNINRVFSTRTSLFLSKFNTSPNFVTTFVFFFTLWGAWMVATGEYMYIALGGLIFQIASILDGCDGELARLTYKGSRFGAWYDTITDNIRYVVFLTALGIGAYTATGNEIYFYCAIVLAVFASYTAFIMGRFVWQNGGPLTNLEVTKQVDENVNNSEGIFSKIVKNLRGIEKQDVSAFMAFILCIIGLYKVMFWIAFVGVIIAAFAVTKSINAAKKRAAELS